MAVTLLFSGFFDVQRRFLIAVRRPTAPMIFQALAMVIQIIANLFFVSKDSLRGYACSALISQIFLCISTIFFTLFIKELTPQNPFTQEALKSMTDLQEMKIFLMISIPSMLMLLLEMAASQFLNLMSGYLG